MRKARYRPNSHNCQQSAFASPDKYAIYLINLFGQGGHAAALPRARKEKKHTNASKNGGFITVVVFCLFVLKTVREAAPVTPPSAHTHLT